MNHLVASGSGSSKGPYLPVEGKRLIGNRLPFDLFGRTLSCLEGRDIQRTCSVNRLWSAQAIDTTKHENFSMVNCALKVLCENLSEEPYNGARQQLLELARSVEILDATNLVELQSCLCALKKGAIEILQSVDDVKLMSLKGIFKERKVSRYFEQVLDLAMIYGKIDWVLSIPIESVNVGYLRGTSLSLAKHDDCEKALEVAHWISAESEKAYALRDISKELALKGYSDRAVDVAGMIPLGREKLYALIDVSDVLIGRGEFKKGREAAERAMEVMSVIHDVFERRMLHQRLAALLEVATNCMTGG